MSQAENNSGSQAEEAQAAEEREPNHEELKLLLEDTRSKVDEHYSQLLRTQAELENLRKRTSRELENAHRYALGEFVNELLPVRDSMELGLSAADDAKVDPEKLKEGMELTLKMLAAALEKFGVREIDPKGERFNPELHQALSMQAAPEFEPNTVVTVVQKGYQLHDRLVRPALVIVSTGGKKKDDSGGYSPEDGQSGGQIDEQA